MAPRTHGASRILVVLSREPRNGPFVVTIDDQGPGIPEDNLESIFQRFYSERPTEHFGQHSGLGLSICRQIMETYGGSIAATNRRAADGRVLGATAFVNTRAAYDDLAPELKSRLANATATHDFNKFWENMRRRPGSLRGPLTAEQRRRRPPSVHPVFLTHPITGRQVLYCNPGYAIRINELDEAESDRVLDRLFEHQLQPKYQYTHQWTEGDVLVWDHIGTLHNAIADYRPDEHRLMKRCQVMADRIFDPGFLREALSAVSAPAGAR